MHIYQPSEYKETRLPDIEGFFKKLVSGDVIFDEFKEHGLQSTKTLIKYDIWESVIR